MRNRPCVARANAWCGGFCRSKSVARLEDAIDFSVEDGVAHDDERDDMSYSGYLQLDRILQAQQPLSTAHDEMLFIIQHQTSELWMKLAIHELNVTCRMIAEDNLQPAFKTLSRVSRILEQLNSAWDVLRTMTPSEYTQFRGALGQSSGFQSWQYRMIEFLVGNKNAAMISVHARMTRRSSNGSRRRLPPRASTITPSGCCIVAASVSTRPCIDRDVSHAACLQRQRVERHGYWSIAIRRVSGNCMSSPKSWSISKIISAAGVSTMSRRSSGSSASSAAPAAHRAFLTCERCWTWCCFPSSGKPGPQL